MNKEIVKKIDEMVRSINDNAEDKAYIKTSVEILKTLTAHVLGLIGPIPERMGPFLAFVLETIAATIRGRDKMTDAVVQALYGLFEEEAISFNVPHKDGEDDG